MRKSLLLFFTFFIFCFTGIFTKLASQQVPMSMAYLGCLVGAIVVLGLYAILWQKVLSFMPLNKAFLCKSITLILGLLVAHFVFAEVITLSNIVGAAFIIGGLVVLATQKVNHHDPD